MTAFAMIVVFIAILFVICLRLLKRSTGLRQ
jgi:hypothetical protein